jgi:magnesium-transporting ATPase (P-type)
VVSGEVVGDPLELAMVQSVDAVVGDTVQQCCAIEGHSGCLCALTVEKHIGAAAFAAASASLSNNTSSTSAPAPAPRSSRAPSAASASAREVWAVLKQYPFSSQLMRMSVLASAPSGARFVFTKGSPEKIQELCAPASVPADFDDVVRRYTKEGLRVIAMAYKPLGSDTGRNTNTNARASTNTQRSINTASPSTSSPRPPRSPVLLSSVAEVIPEQPEQEQEHDDDGSLHGGVLSHAHTHAHTHGHGHTLQPALDGFALDEDEDEDEDDEDDSSSSDAELEAHVAATAAAPLLSSSLAPLPANTQGPTGVAALIAPAASAPQPPAAPERSEAEAGLRFLALLVFENPLKPMSAPTIDALHAAGLRTVMITGDTALTAFAVAKQAGILKPGRHLFAAKLSARKDDTAAALAALIQESGNSANSGSGSGRALGDAGTYGTNSNYLQRSLNRSFRHEAGKSGSDAKYTRNALAPLAPAAAGSLARSGVGLGLGMAPRSTSSFARMSSSVVRGVGMGSGYGSLSRSLTLVTASSLRHSLVFEHVLHPHQRLDPVSLRPYYLRRGALTWGWDPEVDWAALAAEGTPGAVAVDTAPCVPFELALSGDVLSHLLLDRSPAAAEYLGLLLTSSAVFCRVSPEHKAFVVKTLMRMGLYVSMCGDGANDAPALKAAHLGVSLSQSEASVAAPFTSQISNISCVPRVLLQGRSALATCFLLFRYMALYSVIQFSCCIQLYFKGANLGDVQFLVHDMLLVFPLVVLLGDSHAADTLTRKRPSGNLLSAYNLISVFSHMFICIAVQLSLFVAVPHFAGYQDLPNGNFAAHKMEVSALYHLCNLQYLLLAVLFALQSPWKQPLHRQTPLLAWIVFAGVASLALLLGTADGGWAAAALGLRSWRDCWLTADDVDLPMPMRWAVLGRFLVHVAAATAHQLLLLPRVRLALDRWRQRQCTDTDYGRGGLVSQGSKVYHVLRRRVEDQWYPRGRPAATQPSYGAHAHAQTGTLRPRASDGWFYDTFACYGGAAEEETITMLPRKRVYEDMLGNERVAPHEVADAEMRASAEDADYGQVNAVAWGRSSNRYNASFGAMSFPRGSKVL